MEFLEKDLEDIIFNADRQKLLEKGLTITNGKLLRQLKIGNYGICDLLGYERPMYHHYFKQVFKGTITIYELKQKDIGVTTFLQALRYLQGVRSFLEKKGISQNYNYEIVLIGKNILKYDEFIYLTNFLNIEPDGIIGLEPILRLKLYTYNYGIDGIEFNQCENYKLSNEGF